MDLSSPCEPGPFNIYSSNSDDFTTRRAPFERFQLRQDRATQHDPFSSLKDHRRCNYPLECRPDRQRNAYDLKAHDQHCPRQYKAHEHCRLERNCYFNHYRVRFTLDCPNCTSHHYRFAFARNRDPRSTRTSTSSRRRDLQDPRFQPSLRSDQAWAIYHARNPSTSDTYDFEPLTFEPRIGPTHASFRLKIATIAHVIHAAHATLA